MCEPATIAMLAITAAGALVAHEEQANQAQHQELAAKKQEDLQQNDLNRQQQQIDEQAKQAMNEQARKAMKDMALFDVITGEYGGGNSASRAATVATVQQGETLATIAGNRDKAQVENRFDSLATTARTNAMLASIRHPSWAQTGLTIAGAGMDAYTGYQKTQAPRG
jgi:hypothetical protein